MLLGGSFLYSSFSSNEISSANKNSAISRVTVNITSQDKDVIWSKKTSKYVNYYNIYKEKNIPVSVKFYQNTNEPVYYKIFLFESDNYKSKASIYKSCTRLSGGLNSTKQEVLSISLSQNIKARTVKVKAYSSLKECNADKSSNEMSSYKEAMTASIFELRTLGDVATAPKYNIKDGKITREDVELISKFAIGKENKNAARIKYADIDGDGKITSVDARIASIIASNINGYQYGDINKDKKINNKDVDLILKYFTGKRDGFDSVKIKLCDINGDGKITSLDARLLSRIILGYGDVATAPDYGKGDGKLTKDDADAILKLSVQSINPTSEQKYAADVNEDGKITSEDAKIVLNSLTN